MTEFDDYQILNRIQVHGGYRVKRDYLDSEKTKIPIRDIYRIIDKVCTPSICESLRGMYYLDKTDDEIKAALKHRSVYAGQLKFQNGRDDIRYRLATGDILNVAAVLLK